MCNWIRERRPSIAKCSGTYRKIRVLSGSFKVTKSRNPQILKADRSPNTPRYLNLTKLESLTFPTWTPRLGMNGSFLLQTVCAWGSPEGRLLPLCVPFWRTSGKGGQRRSFVQPDCNVFVASLSGRGGSRRESGGSFRVTRGGSHGGVVGDFTAFLQLVFFLVLN